MRAVIWGLVLCLTQWAFAYDLSDFVREANAHHARRMGAAGGLKLNVAGEVTEPGKDAFSITATYYSRDKRWRADAVLSQRGGAEGLPFNVLFDGQKTWATLLGMKIEVPRRDVDDRVRGYLYWEEPPAIAKLIGDETVGGRACWLIETPLRESDGTAVTLRSWYDKEYFVILQTETSYDRKPIRIEFSDLRAVSGDYVIPHKLRAVQNDVQVVEAQITGSPTGAEIGDSLFDSAQLPGSDFPDMNELMRSMKIFGKVITNEMSKMLKN
ncbi:MAG: hypothetical protein IPG71_10785 [bacterium]|nr:hypothetical protein [bacterium]